MDIYEVVSEFLEIEFALRAFVQNEFPKELKDHKPLSKEETAANKSEDLQKLKEEAEKKRAEEQRRLDRCRKNHEEKKSSKKSKRAHGSRRRKRSDSGNSVSTLGNSSTECQQSAEETDDGKGVPDDGRKNATRISKKEDEDDMSDFKKGLKRDPFEDGKSLQKIRKANPCLLKAYWLLIEKYNWRLACKSCLVRIQGQSSGPCRFEFLKSPDHKCPKDHLAVRAKKSKSTDCWTLVRNVDSKSKFLCHQFATGQQCRLGHDCPCPNTIGELEVWFVYLKNRKPSELVGEILDSDLFVRAELTRLYRKCPGAFHHACSTCHSGEERRLMKKKKHSPSLCEAGHDWVGKAFYGAQEVHRAEEECKHDHCLLFRRLLKLGFEEDTIISLSRSMEQSKSSSKGKKEGEGREKSPFDFPKPPVLLHKACDDGRKSLDDMVGFPFQDVDGEDYEREMKEEYDDFCAEEEPASSSSYYRMLPRVQLEDLLRTRGDTFKRCRFSCSETSRAICDFLDRDQSSQSAVSVELRSRKNCGPCFDGDEVVVELKDTRELGDDGSTVKRGTIVGVLGHAFNRREYFFLCKMDPHVNHLMIPINGIGPKIHVWREKERYDHRNMVFVYKNSKAGLELTKSCYLSPEDKESTLFVVRYLQWRFDFMYPSGYVCAVLKAGTTIEESQTILNVVHQVPGDHGSDEAEGPGREEEPLTFEGEDLTGLFTISIDPEGSRDLDDAISVVTQPNGHRTVVVHVSDVARCVRPGDRVDLEASKRMTSYYPAVGRARSMLPRGLSEGTCSLLEGRRRQTLSVFFEFDGSGRMDPSCGPPVIRETSIVNDKQLTYEQAQRVLDEGRADDDRLNSTLAFLFRASRALRRNRLRMGWMFRESERPFEAFDCSDAHQIVEEFMVLTNMTVAKFVVDRFPEVVPLRSQLEPSKENKKAWVEEWSFVANGSVYFDQFFQLNGTGDGFLPLLRQTTENLEGCMSRAEVKKAVGLIGQESKHPVHAVALAEWYSIQEKAIYTCSGEDGSEAQGHYSLEMALYTQFTSPLRRYLDLIVHRLVKAALRGDSSPHATVEVTRLCNKANVISGINRKYNREVNLLRIAKSLERPLYIPVFIRHFEEGLTEFISPFLPKIGLRYGKIKHNQLSLSDKPDVRRPPSGPEELRLMWDARIFDADRAVFESFHARKDADDEAAIDPKRHIDEVHVKIWGSLLRSLDGEVWEEVQKDWHEVVKNKRLRSICRMGAEEVTSEMEHDGVMVRPQRKFSLDLKKGSVIAVQVGVGSLDGYLRPQIKMISLTKQLDICLCHKRDPVGCFASVSKGYACDHYSNVDEYLSTWKSLVSMEAAETAVTNSGDTLFCHNVPVSLYNDQDGHYFGRLILEGSFCKKRRIAVKTKDNDGGFLCLRFPLKCQDAKSFIQNKWLCHAAVDSIEDLECDDKNGDQVKKEKIKKKGEKKEENKMREIKFRVQRYDCSPPEEILSSLSLKCTMEFLSKPLPERKMINSLDRLKESSRLCQAIALGHSLDHLNSSFDVPAQWHSKTFKGNIVDSGFQENNEAQAMAIRRALTHPFTLIQGPPGTGKTVTGIKIAYWFARGNLNSERKVMYCGPSNSSVDVAAEWLKKLGTMCPRIVRVYGQAIERRWYPSLRYHVTLPSSGKGKQAPPSEDTIDLHHLIRQPGKPYASRINKLDQEFRDHLDCPEEVSDEKIELYEKLINEASNEELQNYDIILCTCTASCSKRFEDIHVSQLIVDECAMCKEPESLIPLISHKDIKQVVLIGDHKQLQPIVKNKNASELGLQRSLFERYKDEAIMLTCQYRMHPSICWFPSKQFYDGKLKTAGERRSPFLIRFWPNDNHPHIFCHVEGAEKSAVVSTSEGNEASKSNEIEAREAIKIYRELCFAMRFSKSNASICFLSQYEAQCALIKNELVASGNSDCLVSTVVSSQGNEYDYVILSLVRSMPQYEIERSPSIGWCRKNLGFITDEHQINVALTRARHGLIIIGNKNLLTCNALFNDLLSDYRNKGCLVDAEKFAPSFNRHYQEHMDEKYGRPYQPGNERLQRDQGPSGFHNRHNQGPSGFYNQRNQGPSGFYNQHNQGPSGFYNRHNQGPPGFYNQHNQGPPGFYNRQNQGPPGFYNRHNQGPSGFYNQRNQGPSGFYNLNNRVHPGEEYGRPHQPEDERPQRDQRPARFR